jgi:hypothetical protein
MAENPSLEGFLREGAATPPPAAAQPPAEPAAPTTPPAEVKAPTPAPAPATKAPEAKDDDDPPFTGEDGRTVPMAALDKIRNDWRSKFAAEQARAQMLEKQLEEAKRPPPAPPQPRYEPPPPDYHQDPVAYIQYARMQDARDRLNERLNASEYDLRDKIGDEKVDQYVADFRAFADKDRALWDKLYAQPRPYLWLTKEIDRLRLSNEIGDDPSAYRARLVAEERAKWEAERAAAAPPAPSPAANLPPSLANARSVAARTSPAFTGEPSLEDVVHSIRTRKQRQH